MVTIDNHAAPFGSLFQDPKSFRGDCALLRRAISRKWLHAAPQSYRDAVLRSLCECEAVQEMARGGSSAHSVRVTLAFVRAVIAWEGEEQRERHAVWDWVMGWGPKPSWCDAHENSDDSAR